MDKNKERAERWRHGRESLECKAMFSRNVLPPVLSCNVTGKSPESCLTDTQRRREGGKDVWKMVTARWMENKKGYTSNP